MTYQIEIKRRRFSTVENVAGPDFLDDTVSDAATDAWAEAWAGGTRSYALHVTNNHTVALFVAPSDEVDPDRFWVVLPGGQRSFFIGPNTPVQVKLVEAEV